MNQRKNSLERLRDWLIPLLNRAMVFLWRLGLGQLINIWPSLTGRIMILKHHERRTGSPIFTPVNYIERNGSIFCIASLGEESDWFLNLMANPQVEVWLPDGWYAGQAKVVEDPEKRSAALRETLEANPPAARLVGVNPNMPEDEFAAATTTTKLIRVKRQAARTGADGPGGLAWLWPFVVLFFILTRGKKRR